MLDGWLVIYFTEWTVDSCSQNNNICFHSNLHNFENEVCFSFPISSRSFINTSSEWSLPFSQGFAPLHRVEWTPVSSNIQIYSFRPPEQLQLPSTDLRIPLHSGQQAPSGVVTVVQCSGTAGHRRRVHSMTACSAPTCDVLHVHTRHASGLKAEPTL